jgi:hypothetical protein
LHLNNKIINEKFDDILKLDLDKFLDENAKDEEMKLTVKSFKKYVLNK